MHNKVQVNHSYPLSSLVVSEIMGVSSLVVSEMLGLSSLVVSEILGYVHQLSMKQWG